MDRLRQAVRVFVRFKSTCGLIFFEGVFVKLSTYLKEKAHVNLCLLGPPGGGKTFLAASASRLGKTLLIELEGGVISARDVVDEESIEIMPASNLRTAEDTREFERTIRGIGDEGRFEWVILDSFTELAGRLEEDYARTNGTPTIKDWCVMVERLQTVARMLRDGPFHTIVTVLAETRDESSRLAYTPALPGKCKTTIPSYFHTTLLVRAENVGEQNGQRVAHFAYSNAPRLANVRDRYRVIEGRVEISSDHPELLLKRMVDSLV